MDAVNLHDILTAAQANAIFQIAEDAIISVDAEQNIIMFNFGAEKIFGYKAIEVLGKPLNILLPESSRKHHKAFVEGFARSQQPARRMGERGEISGQKKDGSLVPMEASICAIGEGDERVFTAILRDISERKAFNEALEKAKEDAEAADYAKSMFLANMSHEIRTPLNAVVGMTSLILDSELSTEQKDCAETIRSSSEALLSIINDILDYSKIEVGKLELEYQPFDLRACIEDSLDLVSQAASEKQLNLAYLIDDAVPALFVSDVTRLRQILVNLLGNATKFTQHGEVLVSVKAQLTGSDDYKLHFSVTDTGIGIPEARIDEMFESFSQIDVSTTRKYGGTGLGLAISRRLVGIMGGEMWVESEPGQGSTFHFTITASAGSDDLARSFLQEHAIELTAKKVLIVDDNMTNRRILVKQALLWGMVPTATASGIEAMDLVRHGNAFDIAILDMSMPEMDGLELARRIREYRPAASLPMIMLTSLSHKPDSNLVEELQFTAFLNKPIKASQLFESFKQSLGMTSATDQTATKSGFDIGLAQKNPLMILIAEDNAINQKVMQQILQKFGYRSDLASNGQEVLDALKRQHYDLILMDLHMPEMDGLEAARNIQQHLEITEQPRIVAMTANVQPSDRVACLEAGMTDFLAKPIRLEQLRDILGSARQCSPVSKTIKPENVSGEIDYKQINMIRQAQQEDDTDLLASIIDIFTTEAEQCIPAMRLACKQCEWNQLQDHAHRFFTSCSNLGLTRMAEFCTQMEEQAHNSEFDHNALLEQLSKAYHRALPQLTGLKHTPAGD